MRVDAPASSRAPDAAGPRVGASPPGAFGLALALAGASPSALLAAGEGGACSPSTALARRRGDADEGQHKLSRRREEAEPGKGGAAGRPEESVRAGTADLHRPETAPSAALLSTAAVDRLAFEVGRVAGRPSLDMSFGRDLHVRITRSMRGVELLLSARPALRGTAIAELPALVAALRARGVPVARAEVRASGARSPGPDGPGALTPRRGSATNAPTSDPGGTVAKW